MAKNKPKFTTSCGHNVCNCRDAVAGLIEAYQLSRAEAVWTLTDLLGRTVDQAPPHFRDEAAERILTGLLERLGYAQTERQKEKAE